MQWNFWSRKLAEGRQFIIYNSYYVILDDITTFFSNQKRPKVKVGSNSLVASAADVVIAGVVVALPRYRSPLLLLNPRSLGAS